jgi:hypothetical protein
LFFEGVRQVFTGFAEGACADIYGSRALRVPAGPKLVDYVNAILDAVVVVGGGGDSFPKRRINI